MSALPSFPDLIADGEVRRVMRILAAPERQHYRETDVDLEWALIDAHRLVTFCEDGWTREAILAAIEDCGLHDVTCEADRPCIERDIAALLAAPPALERP